MEEHNVIIDDLVMIAVAIYNGTEDKEERLRAFNTINKLEEGTLERLGLTLDPKRVEEDSK